MTRRTQLLWKALTVLFVVCSVASMLAWGVMLTALCSGRRTVPDADHATSYSCHGMIVYMSDLQVTMHHWLIPLGMFFVALSLVAGGMVLLSHVKLRVDLKIDVER